MNKFKEIWNDRVAINSKRRELIQKIDPLLGKYNIDFSRLIDLEGMQSDLDYVSRYLLRNESGFKHYADAVDYIHRFIGNSARKFIAGVCVSSIQSLADELQKKVVLIETELKPIFDDVVVLKLLNEIKALGQQSQALKSQTNSTYGRMTASPVSKVNVIHHD